MNLQSILERYKTLEAELLYDKAISLFNLITDQEIEEILKKDPEHGILLELSSKHPEEIKQDLNLLNSAIELFITTLESRNLTEDEFEAMTLDDIKEYINKLIVDKRSILLGVINRLEEIYKIPI